MREKTISMKYMFLPTKKKLKYVLIMINVINQNQKSTPFLNKFFKFENVCFIWKYLSNLKVQI